PPIIWMRAPAASTRSSGQPAIGGTPSAFGSDTRNTATRVRSRRCTKAFTNWVVPIITAAILSRCSGAAASTAETALMTPLRTSAVVKLFAEASTSLPRISTASVLVPPTSMPSLHAPIRFIRFLATAAGSFRVLEPEPEFDAVGTRRARIADGDVQARIARIDELGVIVLAKQVADEAVEPDAATFDAGAQVDDVIAVLDGDIVRRPIFSAVMLPLGPREPFDIAGERRAILQ